MSPAAPVSIEGLLKQTFAARHVVAALGHFGAMVQAFQRAEWEPAIAKAGKLVEAVLKALWVHVNKPLPPARSFKAGQIIQGLGQLPQGAHDDAVRLTIPRACQFVYDVASNRGARHDPDEVDPNEMDATAAVANCSWIVGEMLRYSQKGAVDEAKVRELLAGLTQRKYPLIEEIDGRVYFHVPGLSARSAALLTLWHSHPGRVRRDDLIAAVVRHHFTRNNANEALNRLGRVIDDGAGGMRLLQPGLQEAEQLMTGAKTRARRRRRR